MSASKTRLDQFLTEGGFVESRTKAAALIMAGQVKVDGKVVDKAGYFVKPDAKIIIKQLPKYVSRGGEKLESANKKFKINFKNPVVLDVGSSTGGFSDYALQNGAKKVYAVDVGTGQLDYSLRTNPKVEVMERTDIRSVTKLDDEPDIVVIDVSFISLRIVLPAVANLVNPETYVIAMAKPHFEADYKTASKHKGVIKNETVRRQILKNVESFLKKDFFIADKADSEVHGAKGNIERFYLLKKLNK